jgi:hypothetical protein
VKKSPGVSPAAKKRSTIWLSPAVLAPVALAVVAAGYFVFQSVQSGRTEAAARAQLLLDVETETSKRPPNSDELSSLVARLQKFEDHATAHDLLAGFARIELARGRVLRAAELFTPIAGRPGASPAEQRLGARLLLRQYEQGAADRSTAQGLLQQVLTFAAAAYADSQEAADLTLEWLAASRLPDAERATRIATQLQQNHASSMGARLAKATADFRLDTPRADLETLRREFDEPPAEIDAMLGLVVLQTGDVGAAVSILEPALQRSPGVIPIRWAAALVFHACALGSPDESAARNDWLVRRDAQLDWLSEMAPTNDERRPQWATMRETR